MEHEPVESSRNRYVAAVLVSTISFCCGNAIGWLSPALVTLRNETTPLNNILSDTEVSLIASSLCIGGLIGTPLFAYISDEYGRRFCALISSVPFMISWLIINETESSVGLMIARCFAGVGCTGAIIVAPTYLNEISKCPENSKLQLLANVANNAGIFVSFVFGKFFIYSSNIWFNLAVPVVFFIAMFQIPDSPVYLIKMKKFKASTKHTSTFIIGNEISNFQEATESIAWMMSLPTNSQVVKETLNDLRSNDNSTAQRNKNNHNHIIKEFLYFYTTSESFKKSFYKCVALFTIQGCTGIFAILSFTTEIFKQSGGILSHTTMPVIIAAQQLVSSCVSIFLQNKLNKKTRLVGTFAISSFCLFSFGTYNFLKTSRYDLTMFRWVPLLTICLAVVTFATGIAVIPFQILKESFSDKAQKTIYAVIIAWMWLIAFLVSLFYINLTKSIDLYGTFWMYGSFSAIGAIFVFFCISGRTEINIEITSDLKDIHENVGDILL